MFYFFRPVLNRRKSFKSHRYFLFFNSGCFFGGTFSPQMAKSRRKLFRGI
jgi:hypothetical protein